MANAPINPEELRPREEAEKPIIPSPETLDIIKEQAEGIIAESSANLGNERSAIETPAVTAELTPEELERLAQIPVESEEAQKILEQTLPTTEVPEEKPEIEDFGGNDDDSDQAQGPTVKEATAETAKTPTEEEQREIAKQTLIEGLKSIDEYKFIIKRAEQIGLLELRRTPDGKLLVFNKNPERAEPILVFDSFDIIRYQKKLDPEQIIKLSIFHYVEQDKQQQVAA